MKLKTLFFIGIAGIFFSGNALASSYKVGKICKVQVMNNSNIAYISPCSVWSSVSGGSDGWICWDMNSGQGEAMYTSAMAAFLSGKIVTVWIDENDTTQTYDSTVQIRIE